MKIFEDFCCFSVFLKTSVKAPVKADFLIPLISKVALSFMSLLVSDVPEAKS